MPSNLVVALGIGKKKAPPPPARYKKPVEKAAEVPAEEIAEPPAPATEEIGEDASLHGLPGEMDDSAGEFGIGPADVDYSDNDLCETCANMGQDGNCTRYNFPVQPTGHCSGGYTPKQDETVLNTVSGGTPESTGTVV